jgi:predicted dehydrogenase
MRIAVAGLGFMGSVHVKAIRTLPGTELAAVISSHDRKLAGDLSGTAGNVAGGGETFDFSSVKKYQTLEGALVDPAIDAIDLCIPSDLHEDACVRCLRAGKHVLLEKPMALTNAGCERVIEEARRAGRILMVGHVLRFFPSYRVLDEAPLGELRSATFRRRCARPTWAAWQADSSRSGGAVLDLLIHDIDFALHLFGPPNSVSATGRIEGDIDIVSAQLAYDDGIAVDITGGWHPGKFPITMKYRVTGVRGCVEYNFNEHAPRLIQGGAATELALETLDGYAAEIDYFGECVRTGQAPARCMPEESARAVRLARMIRESRERGGERVLWKSE